MPTYRGFYSYISGFLYAGIPIYKTSTSAVEQLWNFQNVEYTEITNNKMTAAFAINSNTAEAESLTDKLHLDDHSDQMGSRIGLV